MGVVNGIFGVRGSNSPENQNAIYTGFAQRPLTELAFLYANSHSEDTAVPNWETLRGWNVSYYGPRLDQMMLSRNILITLCQTIETLQERGVCAQGISIFVASPERGAVRLEPIRLSKIAELVQRLNRTLRIVLWGLRHNYVARDYSTGVLPNLRDNYHCLLNLDYIQAIEDSASFGTLVYLWRTITQVLDLAVITYCGAHLVSTAEHYCALSRSNAAPVIELHAPQEAFLYECEEAGLRPLHYVAVSLTCMNDFLKGRKVWALQCPSEPLCIEGPAHVSTTIEDLADIWGPVWKLSEEADAELETSSACFYGIGMGVIIRWPDDTDDTDDTDDIDDTDDLDGVSCHFLPSVAQLTPEHLKLNASEKRRLLIGANVSGGLGVNLSCTEAKVKNLIGVKMIPYGTSGPSSYLDSIMYSLAIGYSGSHIGTSRQYKKRDGMTRKQRMLSRWRLEPEKRNPDVLSLWCGLEISACTKNARRRRLHHLISSQAMLKYRQHGFFDWLDPACKIAVEKAMDEEDPIHIIDLYKEHVEWRKDIGKAISWLFDALADTGITADGDLAAFTFMEDSQDPHQIAIFPRKVHTWTGFLKDTVLVATFAITTDTCLVLPYSGLPGQRCSCFKTDEPLFTILETGIVPVPDFQVMDPFTWSYHIPKGRYLSLESSSTEMLKLVTRLPNQDLVVRWSDIEWMRAILMKLPKETEIVRYREGMEDTNCKAIRAYMISKNWNIPNPAVQNKPTSNRIPQAPLLDVSEGIAPV